MKIKSNRIFELAEEGNKFEETTKQVTLKIRGKDETFTIKPIGYEEAAKQSARQQKIYTINIMNNRDGNNQSIETDDNDGRIKLEIAANYTVDFDDVTNAVAVEYGFKDKYDFVAKALGNEGVPLLYAEINNYTYDNTEKTDDATVEMVDQLGN